jgi:hypothetical protein
MDLRGMPLSVVEAGVLALRERETTMQWLSAYQGSDSDLLTDLAPAVAAAIDAWTAFRGLVAECEAGGGHSYDVLTGDTGPAGIVCSHCSSAWTVEPAPAPPQPPTSEPAEGTAVLAGGAGEPPVDGGGTGEGEPKAIVVAAPPAKADKKPSAKKRPVPVVKPSARVEEPEAEQASEPEAVAVILQACAICTTPIDTDDESLAKANDALVGVIPGALCGGCMLTCEVDEEHVIADYDQAVLSGMRWRKRACRPCAAQLKGA